MMLVYMHSGIRYLALLAGVLCVGYAFYGAFGKRPYDKTMRILAAAFAGSIHLNILVGMSLLFTGRFYGALMGHIFMMVFAAITAQLVPSIMRRRPEDQRTYLPHAIGAMISLALIAGALMAIQRPLFGSIY